jgi:3-isopropylmalate dehydrogenase
VKARIAVIAGDGIGPEVIPEALRVLDSVSRRRGHAFTPEELHFGGMAIDQFGDPLPPATLKSCLAADAVLAGGHRRPEVVIAAG